MPRCRIEIEELEPKRWVAEVEIGGSTARRLPPVRAQGFAQMLEAIAEAYYTHMPQERPVPVPSIADDLLAEAKTKPQLDGDAARKAARELADRVLSPSRKRT